LGGIEHPRARGFSLSCRRANGRSPGSSPPFSSRRGAVCLYSRTVDKHMRGRTAGIREDMEQLRPDALLRPPHEPVVECLARPVFRRSIGPPAAGFQDVNDPTDDASIIDPRFSARIRGQVRRHRLELLVRQPKQVSIHSRSLSEALNHNALIKPTVLWVQTLEVSLKSASHS